MEVNDAALEFRVGTGNYYDRHPYYRLPDDSPVRVQPATEYRFVIILPDGVRHEVGTIRSPAALGRDQIEIAPCRPMAGEVGIRWRDLVEPVDLMVFRSDVIRAHDGGEVHEAGSANDPAALHRELGGGFFRKRTGHWQIPATFLTSSGERTLSLLGFEFIVAQATGPASRFAKGSTLRAVRRLTMHVDGNEGDGR